MSYFNIPQVKEGEERTAVFKDWKTRDLLCEILLELMKMNKQLAEMTGDELTE